MYTVVCSEHSQSEIFRVVKTQHYLGEKNLFLSLSTVGVREELSPKSLVLDAGIFFVGGGLSILFRDCLADTAHPTPKYG